MKDWDDIYSQNNISPAPGGFGRHLNYARTTYTNSEVFWANYVVNNLKGESDAVIADLGCGNGLRAINLIQDIAREIYPRTLKYIGIDLVPDKFTQLNEHMEQVKDTGNYPENLEVSLIQNDVRNLLLDTNSIDAVLASLSLHWLGGIEDVEKGWNEVARVMKPSAILYATVASIYNLMAIGTYGLDYILKSTHNGTTENGFSFEKRTVSGVVTCFSEAMIQRLAFQNGLTLMSSKWYRTGDPFSNGLGDEYPELIDVIAVKN